MEYTVYMAQIHVVYDTYTKGYTLFYPFNLILMDKSKVSYACSIFFVSLNMGNHLFLGEFVHLYAEIDKDNEAYTTDVKIDHST